MSRALSSTFVEAVNAAETDEAFLVLVKIDDADLSDPVRVTSDAVETTSAVQDSDTAANGVDSGTADDSTSNGNDGTLQGDPTWVTDQVADSVWGALSFDGVDDYVNLNSSTIVDGLTSVTVEAWVFVDSLTTGHHRIFSKESVLYVGRHGSNASFYCGDGSGWVDNFQSIGTLSEGLWFHIAYVKTETTGEVFVDGQSIGSVNISQSTLGSNGINAVLGVIDAGNVSQIWNGNMADVRIWNTARTQTEIANNKDARLNGDETGLVGYWRLDNSLGVLQNDPRWTSDAVTSDIVGALSFDGVDDYVDLPSVAAINDVAFKDVDWTIEFNVYIRTHGTPGGNICGDDRALILGRDLNSGTYGQIESQNDGTIRYRGVDGDFAMIATSALDLNTWYHIAVHHDKTSQQARIFVAAVEQASADTTGDSIGSDLSSSIRIGGGFSAGCGDAEFDGIVSEVRIWNTARTQTEIANNKDTRLNGTEAGLVGYWRLDDATIHTYQPFPFEVELPDDTDDMGGALARLRVDAVDRRVVEAVRRVSGVPEVTLEVVLASDPDTVEISWPVFSLSNARYGDQAIEADLTLEVLDQEPFPGPAFNPALFPGLYLLAMSVMVNVWTSIGNGFLAFLAT